MACFKLIAMSKDECSNDVMHVIIKPEGVQSDEVIKNEEMFEQGSVQLTTSEAEFNPLSNSQRMEQNFTAVVGEESKTYFKCVIKNKPVLVDVSQESSEAQLAVATSSPNITVPVVSEEVQCNFPEANVDDSNSELFYTDNDTVGENQDIRDSALILQEKETCKSSSKPYQCNYAGGCGRRFATTAHLRYHTRTHTGEKPFLCPFLGCNRTFTSSGHLKYHFSTHSGEKPFKCQHPDCDRVFAWPAHMKYHMKTHSGERPYKCSFEGCGKSFYVLQRLNVHKRVHTGERPFNCQVVTCMKSFTTAGNLKNHMRIHTGEKPYVCPYDDCQRTFTEHSSMRKHKLIHTGEKPFVCDICGKRFSQSGSRNAHQKRHVSEVRSTNAKELGQLLVAKEDGEEDIGENAALPQIHNLETVENPVQEMTQHEVCTSDQLTDSTALQPGVTQVSTADQLVLSQPVIGKEVSIETTPVPVQNNMDEIIGPNTAAAVMTLAETVMSQQVLIHSMLNGATVISTTNQSHTSDELSVVDQVLQSTEVEQMMQNVVGQQILTNHIQLPMGDDLGQSHDQQGGPLASPLAVDVNSFIQHQHHHQVHQLSNTRRNIENVVQTHGAVEGANMACDEVLDDQTDTQSSSSEEAGVDSQETGRNVEDFDATEHT